MADASQGINRFQPLSGTRAIEYGLFHAGPACAAMLGVQYALFSGMELLRWIIHRTRCSTPTNAKDRRWIFIAAPSERVWPALCAGLEIETLASDPRFESFEARWTHRAELLKLLESQFSSRDANDWAPRLAAQPDLLFEVGRRPTEIANDPQVLANAYVTEAEHPELGSTKRIAFPVHLNSARTGIGNAAP
jgi:crotonobetainyl-CoA:carnitine CoA-transferase CaiB-like acyl-CoA transferase